LNQQESWVTLCTPWMIDEYDISKLNKFTNIWHSRIIRHTLNEYDSLTYFQSKSQVNFLSYFIRILLLCWVFLSDIIEHDDPAELLRNEFFDLSVMSWLPAYFDTTWSRIQSRHNNLWSLTNTANAPSFVTSPSPQKLYDNNFIFHQTNFSDS
jgi:hypothetical protein